MRGGLYRIYKREEWSYFSVSKWKMFNEFDCFNWFFLVILVWRSRLGYNIKKRSKEEKPHLITWSPYDSLSFTWKIKLLRELKSRRNWIYDSNACHSNMKFPTCWSKIRKKGVTGTLFPVGVTLWLGSVWSSVPNGVKVRSLFTSSLSPLLQMSW